MEELKRFQGSTFDTFSMRKLIEDRDTILELTGKIQEMQIGQPEGNSQRGLGAHARDPRPASVSVWSCLSLGSPSALFAQLYVRPHQPKTCPSAKQGTTLSDWKGSAALSPGTSMVRFLKLRRHTGEFANTRRTACNTWFSRPSLPSLVDGHPCPDGCFFFCPRWWVARNHWYTSNEQVFNSKDKTKKSRVTLLASAAASQPFGVPSGGAQQPLCCRTVQCLDMADTLNVHRMCQLCLVCDSLIEIQWLVFQI